MSSPSHKEARQRVIRQRTVLSVILVNTDILQGLAPYRPGYSVVGRWTFPSMPLCNSEGFAQPLLLRHPALQPSMFVPIPGCDVIRGGL